MKFNLRNLLFCIIAVFSFFIFSNSVKASTVFTANNTGDCLRQNPSSQAYNNCANTVSALGAFSPTPVVTVATSTGAGLVNFVRVELSANTYPVQDPNGNINYQMSMIMVCGSGGLGGGYIETSTNTINSSDITTSPQFFDFTFTGTLQNSTQCSFNSSFPFSFYIQKAGGTNTAGTINITSNSSYQPYFQLANSGGITLDPEISFESPPMTEGFISPDFSNWWLSVYIPLNHDPAITGYYYNVSYGTSTPYGIGVDSLKNTIGVLPLGIYSIVRESPLLSKNATTTAGTYKAIATLYDQNNATITQSSILNFTITGNGSTILNVPNNNYSSTTNISILNQNCTATNFALFGADFGKGMCDLTRFLFVPQQAVLNQWTVSKDLMTTRAPFSYFYQLTTSMTSLPTSTSATITPLTLHTGAGGPVDITFDMFSANTINKYTDSSSRSAVRVVIQYSLYLAFITMIIFKIREIFNKPQK